MATAEQKLKFSQSDRESCLRRAQAEIDGMLYKIRTAMFAEESLPFDGLINLFAAYEQARTMTHSYVCQDCEKEIDPEKDDFAIVEAASIITKSGPKKVSLRLVYCADCIPTEDKG